MKHLNKKLHNDNRLITRHNTVWFKKLRKNDTQCNGSFFLSTHVHYVTKPHATLHNRMPSNK